MMMDDKPVELDSTEEVSDAVAKNGARILVVDDDPPILEVAQANLESEGYKVVLASNGREAVDIYSKEPDSIDLILLDVIMPRMGGRECFKELRKINPRCKIILSSGYSREGDVGEMAREGLSGFLQKPYRAKDLFQLVEEALS